MSTQTAAVKNQIESQKEIFLNRSSPYFIRPVDDHLYSKYDDIYNWRRKQLDISDITNDQYKQLERTIEILQREVWASVLQREDWDSSEGFSSEVSSGRVAVEFLEPWFLLDVKKVSGDRVNLWKMLGIPGDPDGPSDGEQDDSGEGEQDDEEEQQRKENLVIELLEKHWKIYQGWFSSGDAGMDEDVFSKINLIKQAKVEFTNDPDIPSGLSGKGTMLIDFFTKADPDEEMLM